MGYFPFYTDIRGVKTVIVGGGQVAFRKLEKLADFEPDLVVIAPEICKEIREFVSEHVKFSFAERSFEFSDLEDAGVVIAATDDAGLNHRISVYCKERHIPVNVVDREEDCSFIFPALIKRGKLTIGISTGGASPMTAVQLKRRIEEQIPGNMEEILDFLYSIRPMVKRELDTESARSALYRKVLEKLMAGEPVSEEELYKLMKEQRT